MRLLRILLSNQTKVPSITSQVTDAWLTYKQECFAPAASSHRCTDAYHRPHGTTASDQLVHRHNTRIRLEYVANPLDDPSLLLQKGTEPDAPSLLTLFTTPAKKLMELIEYSWDREGQLSFFKKSLIPFISYLFAHAAQYRGALMLLLKQKKYQAARSGEIGPVEMELD